VWEDFPRFSLSGVQNQQPETTFGSGLGIAIGNFQLRNTTGSPGLNAGQPLPNFSFDIDPDVRAQVRSGGERQSGYGRARQRDAGDDEVRSLGRTVMCRSQDRSGEKARRIACERPSTLRRARTLQEGSGPRPPTKWSGGNLLSGYEIALSAPTSERCSRL